MKTVVWLACFYALLVGCTLALPNNSAKVRSEARGSGKKHSKHPKHPQSHPHPKHHPHPPPHPHPTITTKSSTPSATLTSSLSTVTIAALATTTTTVTTTATTSTRSTISAGPSFTAIRSQLPPHSFARRDQQQQKRDTTVTVTSSTTTLTTTTTTTTTTAVSTEAPFYAQCGADNFVTSIDQNYIDYLGGSGTTQSAFNTATQDACCASCQTTSGCVAFLYRYPIVPPVPVPRRRSVPSVIFSCTLLISSSCPATYDAHLVLPANTLNVGKSVIGNGNCGRVNVVPLVSPP